MIGICSQIIRQMREFGFCPGFGKKIFRGGKYSAVGVEIGHSSRAATNLPNNIRYNELRYLTHHPFEGRGRIFRSWSAMHRDEAEFKGSMRELLVGDISPSAWARIFVLCLFET
jgi:hypothetical protein